MAPVILLSGPPGAGKTTLAAELARAFEPGVHLPLDDLWPWIVSGWVEPWRPESHGQNVVVHRAARSAALAFASGGYAVVLDGLVLPWTIDRYVDDAALAGVPLHYLVLRPPLEVCLARTAARGSGLADPEAVTHLHRQFDDLGAFEPHVLEDATVEGALAAVASNRFLAVELIGGHERRAIDVVDPDPAWPARFEAERARLAAALADRPHRIEHVGSTAVPGLPAKPIVDVQVSVEDPEDEAPFLAAGYELRVRERGRRLFRTPARDVHVHVCALGSEWERRHLLFRDHLRSHPEDRDRYAAVKRELATQTWETMNHYAQAKTDVITAIMRRAGWQA